MKTIIKYVQCEKKCLEMEKHSLKLPDQQSLQGK